MPRSVLTFTAIICAAVYSKRVSNEGGGLTRSEQGGPGKGAPKQRDQSLTGSVTKSASRSALTCSENPELPLGSTPALSVKDGIS